MLKTEIIRAELERSAQALQAASVLDAGGLIEDAVSRSYFAVLHAARAVLLAHDAVAGSHSAVSRCFDSVLVRPGLIEEEFAAVLARERTRCIEADESLDISWGAETAAGLVRDAQAFVSRMRAYLENRGLL